VQRAQEGRRRARCQCARQFLPHPLGRQCLEFAGLHHAAHHRHGLVGDGEAQGRETRHEPRRAQYPQRILTERRAHVTQHTCLDVGPAAVRVDQRAVGRLGDRIDREVAAPEILFQRDRRIGIDDEAAIAASRLALGPRERVLFPGFGMQEDREIPADRAEAGRFHRSLGFAHDHVVPVTRAQSEQPVAHRAAHQINLHHRMMPCAAHPAA